MDFASLLGMASENSKEKRDNSNIYLSTKISAAKRDAKSSKLSTGVQKFLAKQNAEEKRKREEAEQKKKNLLELRAQNKKSQRVANSMLKRTKSSNKSAIDEAKNDRDTSATLAGRFQCDEDDYGYESKSAGSIYEKLLQKYEANPEDPMAKFARPKSKKAPATPSKPDPSLQPFRRSKPEEEAGKNAPQNKGVQPKKKLPPPPSIQELLKRAKNGETSKPFGSVKPGKKSDREAEFDRPMTAKEKEEFLRERDSKLRKSGKIPPKNPVVTPGTKATTTAKAASAGPAPKAEKAPEKAKKALPTPSQVPKGSASKNPVQKPLKRRMSDIESRPFPGEVVKPKKAVKRMERQRSPSPIRHKSSSSSNRMRIDSDEDEDYDSEMDDFIDDSDAKMDISAEIRNIFGYDRRRFRNEADFDDRSMENNRFSEVMKEEARSAKIGRMEDLEDMRREEEEKRRKMLKKKSRR